MLAYYSLILLLWHKVPHSMLWERGIYFSVNRWVEIQVVSMKGVGSWHLWGFWYFVFSYHPKHSLKSWRNRWLGHQKRVDKKGQRKCWGSWVLGFKVPECHFYTLSETGKSSQLLPRPLSIQDINCMLGSVIVRSVWQRVESERKQSSYVLLSIHSPAQLWLNSCRAECGQPAQLTHPQPSKGQKQNEVPRKEGHQEQKWLKWAKAQSETDNCQQNWEGWRPVTRSPAWAWVSSIIFLGLPLQSCGTELLGTLNQKAAVRTQSC